MRRARWSAPGSFPTRTATANARSRSALDPAPPGRALTFSSACATMFPDLRATAAWQLARDDSLRLVDRQGAVLLELNEVEAGMYETTPSHTHYFLQSSRRSTRNASPTTCSASGNSTAAAPRA